MYKKEEDGIFSAHRHSSKERFVPQESEARRVSYDVLPLRGEGGTRWGLTLLHTEGEYAAINVTGNLVHISACRECTQKIQHFNDSYRKTSMIKATGGETRRMLGSCRCRAELRVEVTVSWRPVRDRLPFFAQKSIALYQALRGGIHS